MSEFPLVLSPTTAVIHSCLYWCISQKIVYKLNYWLTDLMTVALLWSSQYSWVSFCRVLLTVSEAESMVDITYRDYLVSWMICGSLAPERFPPLVQPHSTWQSQCSPLPVAPSCTRMCLLLISHHHFFLHFIDIKKNTSLTWTYIQTWDTSRVWWGGWV